MHFGGYGREIHGPPYIFCLLFKKTENIQEHDLYLNQILHHFDSPPSNCMINKKKFKKRALRALFLYEVSIVVLLIS